MESASLQVSRRYFTRHDLIARRINDERFLSETENREKQKEKRRKNLRKKLRENLSEAPSVKFLWELPFRSWAESLSSEVCEDVRGAQI